MRQELFGLLEELRQNAHDNEVQMPLATGNGYESPATVAEVG